MILKYQIQKSERCKKL